MRLRLLRAPLWALQRWTWVRGYDAVNFALHAVEGTWLPRYYDPQTLTCIRDFCVARHIGRIAAVRMLVASLSRKWRLG